MGLQEVWFVLIAVLFTGYFVLEGFDFGVGMLMPVLGRGRTETADTRRRVLLNTIGPVWDGNEVWLLTAGGAMFAAFPEWYATLFSGFYLPLLLILLGLIVRVVAIEYRGKIDDPTWRRRCDWGIVFGSWVPAVLWGVAFANIVRGVAIDENKQYIGGFFDLLNPYALLGGATTALVFALHGAVFIALKSADEVREDAVKLAARLAVPAVVVAGVFVVWTQLAYGKTWTWLVVGAAAAALLAVVALTRAEREGWAFVFTTVAIVGTVVLLFGSLFPNVMPSTLGDTLSLTIENASSSPYTLKVMTWAAVIVTPVVLIYQGWTYWVFRQRISTKHIPKSIGLSLGTK
ncbi:MULTISPECIES: cytochrome d ubiquinol oxidase subunit II [Rhodococcus]|jgi:cytochrome d ubiquinol oxidase subunit II|uniref:Cytochrome d ubiquinol oxidase subunit II n=1 Tax=Rhodococcus aetherivorans TaxID=191292 RepID=N1LY24_9NOCA|nr:MULTISPECIES: cytochrome d ubiquinol oxidase subunit II [Rhodococcus]NCL73657.1 Cytochrome bd-I ubiquinol oxidase subunit 2 [Rhodococcus sp. YH1]AKE88730.1 cytochrome C oxidase assembly protein [Rhodococcus aetherivorans]KDE14894.1 cytochrome C oxidase assembly protein [Rhodococcus aetherivorans]MBC2591614.1 cytochrome d ubiquinol oxidase subunit II [Rhodococcus aetherivorans]OLL20793.1 cytochrome d ubiquinol oxidase subunit II [Rhodococcus sp. M8]